MCHKCKEPQAQEVIWYSHCHSHCHVGCTCVHCSCSRYRRGDGHTGVRVHRAALRVYPLCVEPQRHAEGRRELHSTYVFLYTCVTVFVSMWSILTGVLLLLGAHNTCVLDWYFPSTTCMQSLYGLCQGVNHTQHQLLCTESYCTAVYCTICADHAAHMPHSRCLTHGITRKKQPPAVCVHTGGVGRCDVTHVHGRGLLSCTFLQRHHGYPAGEDD
jgi:hypothetical protein